MHVGVTPLGASSCKSHPRWRLPYVGYMYEPFQMAPTCICVFYKYNTHVSFILHIFFNFSSHILSYFSVMTSPYIHTRDGYVVFSVSKPPMKMKFWNIFTMTKLKKESMRWLEGEIEFGEEIRRIQRKRTTMNFATGQPRIWLEAA